MSSHLSQPAVRRRTLSDIAAQKGKTPVVVLTAYTAPVARLLDAHVDILLVGDSLGMVLYGMDSTLPVTLDMMIAHTQAVVRSSASAAVVLDMPFGSYQTSPEAAFVACARVMKETGCQGVKLEGGEEMAETIAFLTARGIPVMGHVALTPQHVHVFGGYRYRGRTEAERNKIMKDAKAVSDAGAFAMVLEALEESLARKITQEVMAVTIGIGASPECDGQVLVTEDMLGLTPVHPKFVKQYASLAGEIEKAAGNYAKEVRSRKFPTLAQCFFEKKEGSKK